MGILRPQSSPTASSVLSASGDLMHADLGATKLESRCLLNTTRCNYSPLNDYKTRLTWIEPYEIADMWLWLFSNDNNGSLYPPNFYISNSTFYQRWYSEYLKTGTSLDPHRSEWVPSVRQGPSWPLAMIFNTLVARGRVEKIKVLEEGLGGWDGSKHFWGSIYLPTCLETYNILTTNTAVPVDTWPGHLLCS